MLVAALRVLSDGVATTDVMKVVVQLEVMFAVISIPGSVHSQWRLLAALRVIVIGEEFRKGRREF